MTTFQWGQRPQVFTPIPATSRASQSRLDRIANARKRRRIPVERQKKTQKQEKPEKPEKSEKTQKTEHTETSKKKHIPQNEPEQPKHAALPPTKSDLLTDVMAPSTTKEIIGNANVNHKFIAWTKARADGVWNQKYPLIAVISGPPGCGKTTIATLALKEVKCKAFEVNASMNRSATQLDNAVRGACRHKSFVTKRLCGVILDEIDGSVMGHGEKDDDLDNSAIGMLLKFVDEIKPGARVGPIVCVCNWVASKPVRALIAKSAHFRMHRLWDKDVDLVLARAMRAGTLPAMPLMLRQSLVACAKGDARQVLHAAKLSVRVTPPTKKNQIDAIVKSADHTGNVFANTRTILEHQHLSSHQLYTNLAQDYSIMTLMLQENALKYTKFTKNEIVRCEDLDAMVGLADLASEADTLPWTMQSTQGVIFGVGARTLTTKRMSDEEIEFSQTFAQKRKMSENASAMREIARAMGGCSTWVTRQTWSYVTHKPEFFNAVQTEYKLNKVCCDVYNTNRLNFCF
jgi:hypothetical protein